LSNVQIPNLPAATSLNGNEQLEAVQSGTSVRVSTQSIADYVNTTYPPPGVTQVDTAGGLSGGPITSTGTIQIAAGGVDNSKLADMPTATIKGNDGLSSGPPQDLTVNEVSTLLGLAQSAFTDTTDAANITSGTLGAGRYSGSLSQAIDLMTAATDVEGSILYRGASTWNSIPPGTTGQILQTQGSGAAPEWATLPGTGTVTQIDTGTGLTGGPITLTGTISLANTAVTPGSYGSATNAPTFTVDGQGRLTAANSVTVTPAFSSITSKPTTLAGYGITDAVPSSRTITAGTGLSGGGNLTVDRTISIADTTVTAGSYGSQSSVPTFTVNAQGQLTAVTPATINAVTLTTGSITNTPTSANDIVNKAYVDNISAGINFHEAVDYATAAALPAYTYNNGTGGVGATITANANGALVVDGYTFVSPGDIGKRVLVKNETSTNAPYNGVYNVSQVGSGSLPFILTRSTDFDTAGNGPNQIDAGDFFLVLSGTANAGTAWVQQTPLPITVGTTGIVFTQFAAGGSYAAGTGLNLVGNVFNIANTGVTAATYGSASAVPVIAVNAQGQITSATTAALGTMATQDANNVAITGGSATFTSPSVVSVSSASDAFRITQTGAGNALLVEDDTNPDSSPFVVTASGNVGIGATPTTKLTIYDPTTTTVLVQGDAATNLTLTRSSTDVTQPNFTMRKARGTTASPTAVASGDNVGLVNFTAYGGTNFRSIASLSGGVDTYTSDTNISGFLAFSTNSGSTSGTERMRITAAGDLLVGTTTNPNSSRLHLLAGGNSRMLQLTSTDADSSAGMGLTNDAVAWNFSARGDVSDALVFRNITAGVDVVTFTTAGQVQIGAGTVSAPALSTTGDTNTGIFFPAADTIALVEGGVEALRINSDAQVVTTAGTVSLPAITTTGDTNTGIFFPAADTIAFSEGGAESMRIDASGNVGIGTTSPTLPLTIGPSTLPAGVSPVGQMITSEATGQVPILSVRRSAATGNAVISQYTSSGTAASPTAVADGRGLGRNNWFGFDGTNYVEAAFISAAVDGTPGTGDMPGRLVFATTLDGASSPTERMRIDNAGNVNIATSGKAQRLYVNGNAASVISAIGSTSGTITLNLANANNFSLTLNANATNTLANPSNLEPGQSGVIYVSQDATGSRTLAYGTSWDFPGGTAPTLTTTANAVDAIVYTVRSATSITAQLISNIGG